MMRSKRKGCSFLKQEGKRHAGKREAAEPVWLKQGKGVVIGLLAAVLLLGLCSALVAAAVIPERGMEGCVLGCCAVGAMLGTAIGVRGSGKRKLLNGVCTGAAMAVVLGVSGFLLYRELDAVWGMAVAAACVLGGAVAGILSRNKGRKRRG